MKFRPSSPGLQTPMLIAALVTFHAFCLSPGVEVAAAALFTQEAAGRQSDGSLQSQTIIDPGAMPDLARQTYDLGEGRQLEIHTNLAVSRADEINSLAAVIQRCYTYLEKASGRKIPGGVLLYLIEYPERPRYYRFQAEVDDSANWNEVRVALLNAGQPLLGAGSSKHVTEFIYDTLPHELTHSLLTVVPTLRHDLDGQATQGTRWFIEGVCEKWAKGFAAVENPAFCRQALKTRHLDPTQRRSSLGSLVWSWSQSNDLPWSDESDLYGLSMLLVAAWAEYIELKDLLALMSSQGGDLNGDDLADLLRETTRSGQGQLLARARNLGRSIVPLPEISFSQRP